MATNATDTAVDDSKEVTEEDLRDLKYGSDGVESSKETDETDKTTENIKDTEEAGEEDGQTDNQTEQETTEDKTEEESEQFVKEFPNLKGNTPEEYAKSLETAYRNSFAELKRIRDEAAAKETPIGKVDDEIEEFDTSDPVSLYMKQKMDEEISNTFEQFSKEFPQAKDPSEYDKFTQEVALLSKTILASQKRLASPKELYLKAAVILGWESANKVTDKEKLGIAMKNSAATSKTTSAAAKKANHSKVTDQMVAANRLMYPDKTDAQIREELEPYVQ